MNLENLIALIPTSIHSERLKSFIAPARYRQSLGKTYRNHALLGMKWEILRLKGDQGCRLEGQAQLHE